MLLKQPGRRWLDSGLQSAEQSAPRAGVAIGSGIGGLPGIEENCLALDKGGPRKISPFFIPGSIINMAAGLVSMKHHFNGSKYFYCHGLYYRCT